MTVERVWLDGTKVAGPLELRNWRPGDQYRRVGSAGEEKIKTFFQEARIPLWERRHWPVLTAEGINRFSEKVRPGRAGGGGAGLAALCDSGPGGRAAAVSGDRNNRESGMVWRRLIGYSRLWRCREFQY